MATKRIFSINGNSINTMIKGLFNNINNSRLMVKSKTGNTLLNISLLFVIIAVVFFPVILIAGVIFSILFKYDISIEREITSDVKLIDNN